MCHGHHFLQKTSAKNKERESLKWSSVPLKVTLPPILFPSSSFLAKVGAENIFNIVLHHHRLLQQSSIAHLYPRDEAHFLEGVTKASHFLIQALGGEKAYTLSYGSPALCRTHAPFAIDDEGREVWLRMYKRTLQELHFPKELIGEFWNWIEPFSMCMVNRPSSTSHLKRFAYEDLEVG